MIFKIVLFFIITFSVVNVWAEDILPYIKRAQNGHVHSMAYLGQNYYTADLVPQDLEKAFRWLHAASSGGNNEARNWLSKMYFMGDGAQRNYLAAYKWVVLSQNSGNKDAQKLVKFLEPKIEYFRKRRYKELEQTAKEKKAFGLILGKEFPDELVNENYNAYSRNETIEYIFKNIKPIYAKNSETQMKKLRVYVTPLSHTVYKIRAHNYFASELTCTQYMQNYLNKIETTGIKSEKDSAGLNVNYKDSGVEVSPTLPNKPDTIKSLNNLQGLRHITRCNGALGEITVIDFASKELAIAEAIEKEPFFNTYFGQELNVQNDYMSLFGLNFLKPYKESKVNFNEYTKINPPSPSSMFQTYKIKTSVLTNTLYSITGAGTFKNKERCMVGIGSIITKFSNSYKKKNSKHQQQWLKNYGGYISSFYINESGSTKNYDKVSQDLVRVRMGCTNPQNHNGVDWKGWINITSLFAKKINNFELKLITDQGD